MLDSETKRRIDGLRDLLVGKIPMPTDQVEQITLALMYKFMFDMDEQNKKIGGKAEFFSGEYRPYAWDKIMDKALDREQRVKLYSDGMDKMKDNPNIPLLFREIFRGAFLNFRDPETVKLFLQGIDEFKYDSSEKLGDAFEYLLSVLGSQGDAGQFRTPRHIIDFIVKVVDPKKEEKILDPACGSAGFLLYAFKHILEQNKAKGNENPGSGLTVADRKKLTNNFVGYDISPDMVRLSRVNMYLHHFPDPKLYEYDTLTSQDRWDEDYDVILANPPFMTPKGGIRPHNRFSIKANRSEVLFVDYILEHLTTNGKAGIIVPDGIVSNEVNNNILLRKAMFTNNNIYAVVSLPPGTFKPYAEVKTHILFLDRTLSPKTDEILFVEIEHDGYESGNRKREIAANDLPDALNTILDFKNSIIKKTLNAFKKQITTSTNAFLVAKEEISKDDRYILRGSWYKKGKIASDVQQITLGDYIEEIRENNADSNILDVWSVSNEMGIVKSNEYFSGNVFSEELSKYKKVFPRCFVYNPARINVGSIALNKSREIGVVSPMYVVFKVKKNDAIVEEYLLHILKSDGAREIIKNATSGAVRQSLAFPDLAKLKVPITDINLQNHIRALDRIIDRAKELIKTFVPIVNIDKDWPLVNLMDYFDLKKGKSPITKTEKGEYPLVTTAKIFSTCKVYDYDAEAICIPTISASGHGKADVGNINYIKGKFGLGNILMAMIPKSNKVVTRFYHHYFNQEKNRYFKPLMSGTTNVSFSIDDCKELLIPLPVKEKQESIVQQIEKEQNIIMSIETLTKSYGDKIKDIISVFWKSK